jgi:hypothetical protein
MEKSKNLISWIALMVALFFAGSMILGTCNRTRYLREQLKEINASYESIQRRMDSITVASQREETEVLKKIEATYANLDSLQKLKSQATSRINTIRRVEAAKPAGVSGFNLK